MLAGSAFLLLAIKAIMRCHTIRVPTLNYDKTIQMLGIRLPSLLEPTPSRDPRLSFWRLPLILVETCGKGRGRVSFEWGESGNSLEILD